MMRQIDIAVGAQFGTWTVIGKVLSYKAGTKMKVRRYLCLCECGAKRRVRSDYLRYGRSKSCGARVGHLVPQTKVGLDMQGVLMAWNRAAGSKPADGSYATRAGIGIQ